MVRFNVEAHEIKTDPGRAAKVFEKAVLTIRGPEAEISQQLSILLLERRFF